MTAVLNGYPNLAQCRCDGPANVVWASALDLEPLADTLKCFGDGIASDRTVRSTAWKYERATVSIRQRFAHYNDSHACQRHAMGEAVLSALGG